MSDPKRAKHLVNCAQQLKSGSYTNKLLKSYFVNTSRKLSPDHLYRITPASHCVHCSLQWGENSLHIKPKTRRTTSKASKAKKLVAILESEEKRIEGAVHSSREESHLTKRRRRRAKWLRKRLQTRLIIKCGFCHRETGIHIENDKSDNKIDNILQPQGKISHLNISAEKQRNKRANSILCNTNDKNKKLENKNAKQLDTTITVRSHMKNEGKKTQPTSKIPMESKTKRNSLLQLASLLKTQISLKKVDSTKNGLDVLLK